MRLTLLRSQFLAATAALAVSCITDSPAAAERILVYNHRIFIGSRINDVRTEALLDSAAEATLVDPQLAAAAHLPKGEPVAIKGSGGTARAEIVEGANIEALGLALHPDAIAVTDLSDISRRLVKRRVEMVLGRELFDAARLYIDIRSRSIAVIPTTSQPIGTGLPLSAHAGNESLPVTVNGLAAQAEFDLGNGSDVLISRMFTQKLRLKAVGTSAGGGIGGAVRRQMVVLDRLEVAGKMFRHVRAAIDDQPSANDLNLGVRILGYFVITTDFANRRVWLRPY